MKLVHLTVSCATAAEAEQIMQEALNARLAACGQTWPIKSCYRWKDEVVHAAEHILLLKTIDSHFDAICKLIRSLHSYDLPSIMTVPVEECEPEYLDWILDSTSAIS